MLNAILSSKAGRLHGEEGSVRWLDVFRGSEDLATATIIERLSYLSGKLAWKLLSTAAEGSLPSFRVAELKDIEFWPMWEFEGRHRGVEPDVFIELDLGDPCKKAHVILEAKRGDAAQYEDQWCSEIGAWRETLDIGAESAPDILILLALGGTGPRRGREERARAFKLRAAALVPEGCELVVSLVDWEDLARACASVAPPDIRDKRIVADIRKGLELFGYFHRVVPRQMENLVSRKLSPQTLVALLRK